MANKKFVLLKSAFFVSLFTTASSILGFLIQLILAKFFGASFRMDAYFAALGIPRVLMRLIGLPLNQVYIPLYKETEAKDTNEADQFAAGLFWFLCAFFLIISIGIYFGSSQLANILIPGTDAQTIQLASELINIIAIYIFLAGMYFTTNAIHISKKSFAIPYASNTIANIVTIVYTLLFIQEQGIFAAVYGLTLGAGVQLAINMMYLPSPVFIKPHVPKKMSQAFLKLFIPLALGSFIFRSTPLIERYFASFLPTGNIAIIGYGLQFLESIANLLTAGLGIVLLPVASELSAKKNDAALAKTFSWGVRAVLLLIIPTISYILFFSQDLITGLFQRGSFTPDVTQGVATVLILYTGALAALALGGQLTNILYAKKRHIHVILANLALLPFYILALTYTTRIYGVYGIALSYSLLTVSTIIVYLVMVRHDISIDWQGILQSTIQSCAAALAMIFALFTLQSVLFGNMPHYIYIAIHVAMGGLIYLVGLYAAGNKEFLGILTYARKRFTT